MLSMVRLDRLPLPVRIAGAALLLGLVSGFLFGSALPEPLLPFRYQHTIQLHDATAPGGDEGRPNEEAALTWTITVTWQSAPHASSSSGPAETTPVKR
jgi:hypothetical protein